MEEFVQYSWSPEIKNYVDQVFSWSGYAICVALVARFFIRPRAFRDPWATFCLGVLSVSISAFLIRTFISQNNDFSPFNPACAIVSVIVAIVVSALWLFLSFLSPDNDEYDDDREYYDEEEYEEDDRYERRRDDRGYRNGRVRRARYDRDDRR
ncbi:MAG: hypothetical protein IJU03_07700 [Thermoguttaceae bacterium]|nr:hypothetical protein [Thermoguttaceae bacterium]